MADGTQRCPNCSLEVAASAFQCPRCELLLTGEVVAAGAPAAEAGPRSVVRWLVGEPQAELHTGRPEAPPLAADGEKSTRRMPILPSLDRVPAVVASLRMTDLNLTPFEAWVVSMVDGHSSGVLLAAALQLSELELAVVLQTLVERRVLALAPPPQTGRPQAVQRPGAPPTAAPPRPPPALPELSDARPPTGDEQAGNALQLALQMERAGKITEAARFLEIAIAASPDAAALYNRLAIVVLRESADLVQAKRLLEQAARISPGHAVYARNLELVRQHMSRAG